MGQPAPAVEEMEDVFADLRQALEGEEFASLEEANVFLANRVRQQGQTSLSDFDGLSPEQMHHFLHFPFESEELVVFSGNLSGEPGAPILNLFRLLVDGIGESGLKPTAKGNLPRNFCREAALTYSGEEVHREKTRHGNINSEEGFFELHVTRVVAEMAGLIRKYRGKFILSRNCRKILQEQGYGGIYLRLFQSYSQQFNWAYRDGYPELGFIQQSFLFTLYLLQRYGDRWRPHTFYADRFLQAFPRILEEVEPSPYRTPEETVTSCYTLRMLENYLGFLGLAELQETSRELYSYQFKVRKQPLLDAVVTFNV
jgi:hypothetical protein